MPRSKHTHLLLARIARGSFANDLLPAFLFVKLLKIVGPLGLMTRHQPVMTACANRGEVLRAGHAAVHHHGGLGFVSHALLNDPEHLWSMLR